MTYNYDDERQILMYQYQILKMHHRKYEFDYVFPPLISKYLIKQANNERIKNYFHNLQTLNKFKRHLNLAYFCRKLIAVILCLLSFGLVFIAQDPTDMLVFCLLIIIAQYAMSCVPGSSIPNLIYDYNKKLHAGGARSLVNLYDVMNRYPVKWYDYLI